MKVRLLDVAELELHEAWQWYEARSPETGARFLAEIKATTRLIQEWPEAWHPLGDGIRRCRVGRFPYGHIYFHDASGNLVLAVAHHHREPGYWRDRLTNIPDPEP
jgi:plasmid stabilization system protein ParE